MKHRSLQQPFLLAVILSTLAWSPLLPVDPEGLVQEGDIIFSISQSRQSLAIQKATHSKYSHVGIFLSSGNTLRVLEAVQPVRTYDFHRWVHATNLPHFVIKRIKDRDRVLTKETLTAMRKIGASFLGRDYDGAFAWSDDQLYCSELVWKIYKRTAGIEIGRPRKIRDFDLSSAEVKYQMRMRYGDHIPYDEPVISPGDMFDSDELITVFSN